jgi:hypothetical protein
MSKTVVPSSLASQLLQIIAESKELACQRSIN